MNSKERVAAAIAKKPVDRVPLGFYAVDHDTIANVIGHPTYVRNKPGMKIAFWEGRRDEVVESMKQDIIDFYKKIDCVDLLTFKEACEVPPKGFKPENPPRKIDEKTYEDEKGGVWHLEPEANDMMYHPPPSDIVKEYCVEDFADRTPTEEPDPSCFELSDALVEQFGRERYILGYPGGTMGVTHLGGIENGLMIMALQPEVVKACNDQTLFKYNVMDKYKIRPGCDGVMLENDMAGTNGPMISPGMFRDICFPYYKAKIDNIKKFVPQVVLHNCGNNLPIMDQLIEGGIDAYESIQTTSEMSVKKLADDYGDKICIWGAFALEALVSGNQDDIRKSVRQCFEDAKNASGFILGPSHSIAYGTKYDNFMAMLDEYMKLRDRRMF